MMMVDQKMYFYSNLLNFTVAKELQFTAMIKIDVESPGDG